MALCLTAITTLFQPTLYILRNIRKYRALCCPSIWQWEVMFGSRACMQLFIRQWMLINNRGENTPLILPVVDVITWGISVLVWYTVLLYDHMRHTVLMWSRENILQSQRQSVHSETLSITKKAQKAWSYCYTCDLEIYRLSINSGMVSGGWYWTYFLIINIKW